MNSQPPTEPARQHAHDQHEQDSEPSVVLRVVGMLILAALFIWHDPATTANWHDAVVVVLAALAGYWLTGSALAVALTVTAMCVAALTNGQWHEPDTQTWLWAGIASGGLASIFVLGQRYRAAMTANRVRREQSKSDQSRSPKTPEPDE